MVAQTITKGNIKSDYFTLSEMCRSYTALKHRINNIPSVEILANLQYGIDMVLDPLRRKYGHPIVITSGYRCDKLNKLVGGVPGSWHTKGNAADIHVASEQEARKIFDILKTLPSVDTVLFEHKGPIQWIHVQWDRTKTPRHHYNYNYRA